MKKYGISFHTVDAKKINSIYWERVSFKLAHDTRSFTIVFGVVSVTCTLCFSSIIFCKDDCICKKEVSIFQRTELYRRMDWIPVSCFCILLNYPVLCLIDLVLK